VFDEAEFAMKLVPVVGIPKLHVTPLAILSVSGGRLILDVDDEKEHRLRMDIHPYQAMKIITTDCYAFPYPMYALPQTVCELLDSEWIEELKGVLKKVDNTAAFLNQAHHYLFPLQDDFLEVVSWAIDYHYMPEDAV
jgi:hypothetical protein